MANIEPVSTTWRTDWSKCCLCQKESNEELKSPRSNYNIEDDGYKMIATNVPLFQAINDLPIVLDTNRLDDGGGIEETLRRNRAQYHQSCRLLFNNTKLERARKRRTESSSTKEEEGSSKLRRSNRESRKSECFLCEKQDPLHELRQVMTLHLNQRLNECAQKLNDGKLLAKLSGGDAIAQELQYHITCLSDLYNRERAYLRNLKKKELQQTHENEVYPLALSELILYIVETKSSSEGPAIFRLADMVSLYRQRLEQFGVKSPDVNSTRLKENLLAEIPELEAHKQGRDVLLAFKSDVGLALSQASDYSEAIILGKAAKILRRHMLDHQSTFVGAFHDGCIEEAISPSLLQFVGMVEHGADIKSQLRFGASKTDLAIAQLLQYNCYSRYKEGASTQRHSKDREPPFPVYIGMSIYAKTRKRALVEILHEHGLSISYDRVLEVSGQLGEAVVSKYVEDGLVCPPVLRKGLFTTAAMDNIDHNPTATTAKTSFHGTSISVFQHPTKDNKGEERGQLKFGEKKVKTVPELPDSFTNIHPAFFAKKPSPPKNNPADQEDNSMIWPDAGLLRAQLALEYEWLGKVSVTDGPVDVTWSAHHASRQSSPAFEVSITSLLPLLRDQAHSVSTVKHVIDKIKDIVSFLNPGQVPVIAADQPIYAVAKQVQWHWPEQYGEDKVLIMFGGLHIEMAALKSLGTLLQNSGWTGALVQAGVASPGTAESFLTASSITRTRQMHQITACCLYKLLKAAYNDYSNDCEAVETTGEKLTFENWCDSRKQHIPQFQFWSLVLSMQLATLMLIRSFRESNFDLYCNSLTELIPYFFANNNMNYARWLPIHLRDMVTLKHKHPHLAQEFQNGRFVVHKSGRQFSGMAIDQAHEQANAVVKADGGAIGVTEDPSALRRWMVAGPEVSHLVAQYERASEAREGATETSHHEQTERAQKVFLDNVDKLFQALTDMGNPFQEESKDLLSLDTKDIAHPSASELIKTHYENGKARFEEFIKGLASEESNFYEPIKKNGMDFFRQEPVSLSSTKQKVLKEDCQLFSKLFISCQSRECDLKEFFRHENQSFPAALSDCGKLHNCQKSQLAAILESLVTIPDIEPHADAIIVDGSALVNSLPPRNSRTFAEYAVNDIIPTIKTYSMKYKRTDIVFDVYKSSSLKNETRSKRGHGVRRRVTSNGKMPTNWRNFLRDNNNKTELFSFLAEQIAQISTPNVIIATKEEGAVCTHSISFSEITPCSHEEADTRIFVHARHAAKEGHGVIMIKANDTDVLVIAVIVFPTLQEFGVTQLWIAFGQGHHLRWIPVHNLYVSIGVEKTRGILFFHAFTGCDVVSAFRGKGKKTAWQTWDMCSAVSESFSRLSQYPPTVDDDNLKLLEKFVIMMYDRSSTTECVDDARLDMFARKQRPYEAIPPTQGALLQHVRRAAYQAGCIWSQSTVCQPEVPSPAEWGWRRNGEQWDIIWTELSPIVESCQQLTKCACKSECSGRCKCYRLGLTCSGLCSCKCDE